MARRWHYTLIITLVVVGSITSGLIWFFVSGYSHGTVAPTATPQATATIPKNERQVVEVYNQAVVKQDWSTVYTTTSTSVVGTYTPEQFGVLMNQEVLDKGAISSIKTTSQPVVNTNADGIVYFTISEQVVVIKNGLTQTQSLISVFVLENGVWKFWFSKAL